MSSQMNSQTVKTDVRAIEITGHITSSGEFIADPWYTFDTDVTNISNRRDGDYSARFYDSADNQISVVFFNTGFEAQFRTSEGTVMVPQDRAPVNVITSFPENTARIVIRKGDTEIYSTDVSATAPEVSFIGLNDYDQLGNTVTLNWEATGEKDELFFELWYCPSEDEFLHVASNITGRSYTADLSSLPGTNEGYFYIYATDGVMTGEIDSPWVKVPFKAPEIITMQQDIPQVKITEEILFDVDIYDMQDGWLWWEDEVTWTLNGKDFMTGSTLWVWPYEITPGTHTFTCTATNSAGMSASMDFTFRILDDESDLPDDWSREDIINALSNGFTVPLNRIDAPITRGQFAALMSTLYGTVSEEDYPYPDYVENVVTDCGEDDYDQFLMVHLGVMQAPGGLFEPLKPITQQEAAIIMYRVSALSDPDWFDMNADDADIMDFYTEAIVLEENGPNAFAPEESITNRLALVRLSRFYNTVFE